MLHRMNLARWFEIWRRLPAIERRSALAGLVVVSARTQSPGQCRRQDLWNASKINAGAKHNRNHFERNHFGIPCSTSRGKARQALLPESDLGLIGGAAALGLGRLLHHRL